MYKAVKIHYNSPFEDMKMLTIEINNWRLNYSQIDGVRYEVVSVGEGKKNLVGGTEHIMLMKEA